MKLSQFKNHLQSVDEVTFLKTSGKTVPKHFHVTEVGQINKKFIDCGGTIREEKVVSMQLWESVDVWHRLKPKKLLDIIQLSEEKLGIEDVEVEVEYQTNTIGKFGLEFTDGQFQLLKTKTACLAEDNCGIPQKKQIQEVVAACCPPGGNCC